MNCGWRVGGLIAAAGLAVRLALLWILPPPAQIVRFGDADARSYFEPALNLLHGKGYGFDNGAPTAFHPPGYAAFIVLCGGEPAVVLAAQLGVFLLGCGLVWGVARECGFSRRASMLAAAFFAFYPEFILFDALLLTESLFTFFMLLVFWLLLRLRRGESNPWAVGAALGMAGAALTYLRPTGLYLFPFLLALAAVPRRGVRLRPIGLLAALLVFAVALAPWFARNERVFGVATFAPSGGYNLYMGNRGFSLRGYSEGLDDLHPKGNEAEQDAAYMAAAWKWQREHWSSLPSIWARKWLRLWFNLYDYRGKATLPRLAATLARVLLFAAAIASLRGWRRIDPLLLRLALGGLGLLTAIHVLVHAEARYLTPLLPLLAIAAIAGLAGPARDRSNDETPESL